MKLIKTIERVIKESEELYNNACESNLPIEELDRLEKQYYDSLKLLKLYRNLENKS